MNAISILLYKQKKNFTGHTSKREAPLHIKFAFRAFKKTNGGIISRVYGDEGREFSTNDLKKYYMEVDIPSTTSRFYKMSDNSFAEIAVRKMTGAVVAALLSSKLTHYM